uniref:Uncharacterized protein n=1 Tax=viral metagenome TaxID=1070528 RepID=A0A6C0E3J3_9ZZZZ
MSYLDTTKYIYNMKIAVLDKNGNIITLNFGLLNEIKSHLCKTNTHVIEINNKSNSIDVKWDKLKMNHVADYLCGDLYSKPSCMIDEIIFEHTMKTVKQIEQTYNNKYQIMFYISKIVTR